MYKLIIYLSYTQAGHNRTQRLFWQKRFTHHRNVITSHWRLCWPTRINQPHFSLKYQWASQPYRFIQSPMALPTLICLWSPSFVLKFTCSPNRGVLLLITCCTALILNDYLRSLPPGRFTYRPLPTETLYPVSVSVDIETVTGHHLSRDQNKNALFPLTGLFWSRRYSTMLG